jgi:hypothetical protein
MVTKHTSSVVPAEFIERKIYMIRWRKVMLDSDLAGLYQVDTKTLNRAVKRNLERFPKDFMFELTKQEVANLRCQFGTLSSKHKISPYAFTEHGVSMLSSIT